MEEIKIVQVTPDSKDLASLIEKLDAYLLERYPVEDIFGLDFTDPNVNEVVFIIAYLNDVPIGCSAIRALDDNETELKRFFVEEAYRNKGIAKLLLDELEMRARNLHFKVIKLEAGEPQPEALRFYRKHGYYPIERFGEYVNSESSVCYEKKL